MGKYHTPGLWANTCCTHPFWGEASAGLRHAAIGGGTGPDRHGARIPRYGGIPRGCGRRADRARGRRHLRGRGRAGDRSRSPNADEVKWTTIWQPLDELTEEVAQRPPASRRGLQIYLRDHARSNLRRCDRLSQPPPERATAPPDRSARFSFFCRVVPASDADLARIAGSSRNAHRLQRGRAAISAEGQAGFGRTSPPGSPASIEAVGQGCSVRTAQRPSSCDVAAKVMQDKPAETQHRALFNRNERPGGSPSDRRSARRVERLGETRIGKRDRHAFGFEVFHRFPCLGQMRAEGQEIATS